VGIEGDKSTNCAKTILGVSDSPDTIRDSVRGHVQPFPYFETFPIGLSDGKKVIMVSVPEGGNPPYIMSDGRIYKRQEAASYPIPETNRYTVDMLYSKARDYEDMIERFRTVDYAFCQGESDTPYLQIFINPRPFNHCFIENMLSHKTEILKLLELFNEPFAIEDEEFTNDLNEILKIEDSLRGEKASICGKINFDTINTYYNSIAIRNLKGRSLIYNGLTVEIDIHGNLTILLPLEPLDHSMLYSNYIEAIQRAGIDSIEHIKFLDGKSIFAVIVGLVNKYCNFMLENDYDGDIEIKFRSSNCYRTSLFFSSEALIEDIEKHGLPICMKNEQYFPDFPLQMNISEFISSPIIKSYILFSCVACALGIQMTTAVLAIFQATGRKEKS